MFVLLGAREHFGIDLSDIEIFEKIDVEVKGVLFCLHCSYNAILSDLVRLFKAQ